MKTSLGLAFACLLLITAMPAAAGPVIAPGTKLYVIRTAHFDIIFPERSRPTALRLSETAESVYTEVSGRLQAALPARVPVVITPDQGIFNGNTNPFPYMHIVLYDTTLDLGWTAFKDNFRYLFLHELTHAVSLQIKAPWASFFSGIFGSWVLPGLLNTPEFMVEGVAVSFESADGAGRANDPLVMERVRQDIVENRFKSPIEASGLYDEYPNGNIYYEYGGLFNAYVQKTYGWQKYAELWRAMGTLIVPTSLDPYEVSFYKAFRNVYGIPFIKAWADFREYLSISGLVDPPEVLGPDSLAWMPGGLAGNKGGVYWVDARSNRGMRMDSATLASAAVFDADSSWAISDASPDADGRSGRLLVSRALYLPDGRSRAETAVYDLASRRFQPGSSVADMREARFFRDGIVGIVSNLHDTDLVFVSKAGAKVLLPGTEEIMYSSPAVIDDGRLALIVAIGGRRSIGLFDVESGELSLIKPTGDDADLLNFVRQLSARRGSSGSARALYFNYASGESFYKLGSLDLAAGARELTIETTEFSGGVLWPQEAGGRVFYIGRFSEGEKVCRYPGAAAEQAAEGAASVGANVPADSRRVAFSFEPFDPKPARAARDAEIATSGATTRIEPYRPLAYANPFNMWAAYPDLANISRSLRVFGIFYFQDPIASNTILLNAGYDAGYPFTDASVSWVNDALPVTFSTSLGDNLTYGAAGPPERQSSASLSASLSLPVSPYPRAAILGVGGSFFDRADGAGGSPYGWTYSGWNATASALVGWQGRLPGIAASTSRGIDLMSYHDLDIATLAYKTEAHLIAAYDDVPLRLELWGAWASSPILRLDASSPVFSADRRPPYIEYETQNTGSSDLLAEGSLGYRLADQAIHANILDLYFNRILADIGFRGAYFRDSVFASTFARVSLDIAAAQGMAYGGARIFGEAYARLDGSPFGNAIGFRLGYQLGTDAGTPLRGVFRPSIDVGSYARAGAYAGGLE